uniref:Transmembrane protein n=1 Tax=Pseudo-nitzschia australis TaxID=44445 RepID=A0A7S4AX06_9STRA|mmetsp:Transcript_25021/g.54861  ORF Transcript_25021/g.54861 Transcript_25021/m.54861 type:complete len:162 (-) Transcript_25021:501-986(-)|eukprot:CAMPEP_0168193378 /NCGR_PEP_ID=MMETSP0139_2-20121125/18575_1 /TAXON_ID=44445 /ORGANISM="Pseudo-nitzschia australis, Strain 10249 10 AB" /LENGTH=161 /DNA_ID=CAMNT_0008116731 /DNA_START=64 /DNA_END=552 /DNA_ORIENTATION=+
MPITIATTTTTSTTRIDLCREFLAKLVLEVFGAGGAVWGFSDVCGFRTEAVESLRFWRRLALAIAAVFGARWFLQFKRAWMNLNLDLAVHCRNNQLHASNEKDNENEKKDNSFREMCMLPITGIQCRINNSNKEDSFLTVEDESSDESTALSSFPLSPTMY